MNNSYPYYIERTIEPISTFTLSNGSRLYKKGPIENWIKKKLFFLGVHFLRDDVSVIIDGHKYEPDFVYFDKEKSIYIDIEIDEPYTWRKQPCHYINQKGISSDSRRDDRFVSSGWTVVRFTERQIFEETKSCIGYVTRVIASLDGSFANRYSKMLSWNNPSEETHWTLNQSMQLAKENYRQQYLGFKPGKINAKEILDFSKHELKSILSGQWLK